MATEHPSDVAERLKSAETASKRTLSYVFCFVAINFFFQKNNEEKQTPRYSLIIHCK